MNDRNTGIIDEFRANGGQVGGMFEGMRLLLLHHKGAKTGTERVYPLAYQDLDGAYAIFASKGGADTNPDWFHNLKAHPNVSIEIGTDKLDVTARVTEDAERREIWERQKTIAPPFAEYEKKTARSHIPVIVLDPA